MSKKTLEFFFSFGFMLIGLILLFVSSVIFSPVRSAMILQFPASGARVSGANEVDVNDILPASRSAVPLPKGNSQYAASSTAIAALVMDTRTKSVLYSKNIAEVRPLASITKLMTAMVLLDLPVAWASTTVITEEDARGGDHHVRAGEEFTLNDLWRIALVGSSNTAMNALVRTTGLTAEQFTDMMNKKARELKLPSLYFVEPTGLAEQNVGNPVDVAQLLINALRFEKIYTTVQTGELVVRPVNDAKARRVWSTNWLLTNWIPNDFGMEDIAGKTGYITSSRYNFAVGFNDKRKHNVTVVILGAASSDARFNEARDLAEWIFDNYLWPDDDGYQKLI